MSDQYDVVIVGGGLVGMSFACALAEQPLRIALIEATSLTAERGILDNRHFALSYSSQQILSALNIWPQLSEHATAMAEIHVSAQGRFAALHLQAQEMGMPWFGVVVPAARLIQSLQDQLLASQTIRVFSPVQVAQVKRCEDGHHLCLQDGMELTAKLLVGSDGAQSLVRRAAGIGVKSVDYAQKAVVSMAAFSRPVANTAYERFTPDGHVALLPRGGESYGVVWVAPNVQADALMQMEEMEFKKRLQEVMSYRLGRVQKLGERMQYPLQLHYAEHTIQPGLVLIGNAAQNLHPIAAQGFNLGLRDAAVLAETVVDAERQGRDCGELSVLKRYQEAREQDRKRLIRATDTAVRLFARRLPGISLLRSVGLLSLDLLPGAKRRFAEVAMGRRGFVSRLGCGVPLNDSEKNIEH